MAFSSPASSLFPVRLTPGRMRSGIWTLLSRSGNAHGPEWVTTLPGPIAVCVSLKREWPWSIQVMSVKPTAISNQRQSQTNAIHVILFKVAKTVNTSYGSESNIITHCRSFIRPRPALCISFLQSLCSCLHFSPLRQTGWSSNQSSAMFEDGDAWRVMALADYGPGESLEYCQRHAWASSS